MKWDIGSYLWPLFCQFVNFLEEGVIALLSGGNRVANFAHSAVLCGS